MAVITGYTSLQTAIGDWLAKSNLTDSIPNFIQNWEERFYRSPKNWGRWMESTLSGTIASSVLAVPSDYLALKTIRVDGNPSSRLEKVSVEQLYGRWPRNDGTGIPQWVARDGENFVFGPEPDSAYTIKGVYWAKPTLLRNFASDAAAHHLILNAPDLILYGALVESAPYIKNDARLVTWANLYSAALTDYQDQIRFEEATGPVQEVLA